MRYDIVALPKTRWKGTEIPLTTRSDSYYDVEISPLDHDGCTVSLVRKAAEKEIVHTPDEYDFPDRLYQDHWEHAEAYGVVGDEGELLACIEVCPEDWSNRLTVTELWVAEPLRGKGIGKRLMDRAKEAAVQQKRRAIILETQSCNTKAIGFYLHQGFELIGLDTCCYTNDDIGRREVRINLGFFFHKEGRRRLKYLSFTGREEYRGMASSREYLDFILEQLSGLERIAYRAMMGEFILYYRGKIVGGIYDDRFLVKPTKSALEKMPDADREIPYEGAREMLLVDNVDNREFLTELLTSMYDELPEPKKKK